MKKNTLSYKGTLIAVTDLERSRQFYHDILGLDVEADFGANVALSGGLFLQTADSWTDFIHKEEQDLLYQNHTVELYFEAGDMDAFMQRLEASGAVCLHPLKEHSWGQRGVRFYDPDKHIIEVSEELSAVVQRFMDSGMTIEEIAGRMEVSVEYAKGCLE